MDAPDETFAAWFTERSDAWMKANGRDGKDATLTDLAAVIGIGNTALTHWRNGRARPDPRDVHFASIRRVFALSTEEVRDLFRLCGVDIRPALGEDAEGAA